jgi:molybdopterin converting factor small subunit
MAIVFIPSALRRLTGGIDRVDAAGATVGDVVAAVDRRFPGFGAAVTGDDGALAASLQLFVDGEMSAEGLLAPVGADAEVHLLPALAGGAGYFVSRMAAMPPMTPR